jgi:PAS domain S-box-containing protein
MPDRSNPGNGGRDGDPLAFQEIVHDLASTRRPGALMARVTEGAASLLPCDGVFLEQVGLVRDEVEVVATAGRLVPRVGARAPFPGSLAEEVLARGAPEIVPMAEAGRRLLRGSAAEFCPECSALVLPLLADGDAVGALVVVRTPRREPFTLEEAAALQSLADIAAIAVQRTHLLEDSERSRRDLVESEQRFRLLVSAVGDYAIFMLDPGGRVVSWNEGARRINGYEAEEVVGHHFSRFYTPEDIERRHPENELEIARADGSYEEEGWRLRKDGARFWAHVLITAVRDDAGRLVGFAKVTRDLTERRRMAELRERERERFRAIYENNPSIYLTTDEAGTLTEVNRFGAEYLGFAREELLGRPVLELVHEDDRPRFLEHFRAVVAEPGEVRQIEFRKLRRDGEILHAHETARAVHAGDGRLVVLNVCEDISARVEAEQERERLLAREKEIRREMTELLESITDAFYALDTEWRFTYVNREAERLLQRPRGELLGRRIWDEFPEAMASAFNAMFNRAVAERRTVEFEECYPPLDGWFEVRAYPSSAGLAVYFRDVSRRRAAEAALRESEEQFRQLAENIREVFWISDPGYTRLFYLSPAYEEVWGRPRDAILDDPRAVFDAIHPGDRERVAAAIPGMERGDFDVEYRIVRPDGALRWLHARAFPVRDEEGIVRRVVGTVEDVTARKEAEETSRFIAEAGRLLASSIDYDETLRNVANLAVSSLADWCVVDLCEEREIRRVAVATADPAKEEATQDYVRLYPPDPEARYGGPAVIRSGDSQLVPAIPDALLETVARSPEQLATLRELGFRSAIAVPLKVQDRTLGAITFISSRPDRQYGPDDLRLAEILADRAALSVDKAQLYRQAQAATRIRDEVLSVVSHDLRNPLSTILMSSSFLCDTLPEEQRDTRKQLQIIRRSADQMTRLIQDLLDVAQIEAGRLPVEREPQDPRLLVMEACQSLRPLAEDREIELDCSLPDDLPSVEADRSRVLQVFGNLIGNAIKFSPEGGRIAVSARESEGAVAFTVADGGPGIDPADLPRLFERFYQAQKARKGGAGLGLAIVKGIVEAHGGTVEVRSRLGQGTTFCFTLPRDGGSDGDGSAA